MDEEDKLPIRKYVSVFTPSLECIPTANCVDTTASPAPHHSTNCSLSHGPPRVGGAGCPRSGGWGHDPRARTERRGGGERVGGRRLGRAPLRVRACVHHGQAAQEGRELRKGPHAQHVRHCLRDISNGRMHRGVHADGVRQQAPRPSLE